MSTASRRVWLAVTASAVWVTLLTTTAFAQPEGSRMIPNELMVKFAAGLPVTQARETIQRTGAQIIGEPALDGRLFHVRTADPNSFAAVKATLQSAPGVEYVEPVQAVSIPTPPK